MGSAVVYLACMVNIWIEIGYVLQWLFQKFKVMETSITTFP
jgi:hypothetical protein